MFATKKEPRWDPAIVTAARGLLAAQKTLPAWLLYDARGSALYEAITELPEYYLTRAERSIFEAHADAMVERAAQGHRLHLVELGAGTAAKSQLVVRAAVRMQGPTLFVPVDVSDTALDQACARFVFDSEVELRPLATTHEQALPHVLALGPRRLVLFIGSSIGNYLDPEAIRLLRQVRQAMAPGGGLLLGTDLAKAPEVLIPAYDDAAGVTAAFNKNLLVRLNDALSANFDLEKFHHLALWNATESRVEMHLESRCDQVVSLGPLGQVRFSKGERIHTESSIKYTLPRVEHLLEAAGFRREHTYYDDQKRFAVHFARAN